MRLGLIGDNIASSVAPYLHRTLGRMTGLAVSYERLVPKELGLDFDAVFERCRAHGLRGINVTYPYKEAAATKVRIDDPLVRSIRAVNTVLFEADGPVGYNTDYTGFIAAFRGTMGDTRPGPVCLLGAGGVGKAVAFGLVALGMTRIGLFDPDTAKAGSLADALRESHPDMNVSVAEDCASAASGASGLVNCTPVGMVGHEGTPLPRDMMAGAHWAFDAVYTPVETRFLADAKTNNLRIVSGYELFYHQGVHAWDLFAGRPFEQALLRQALVTATPEDVLA